MKKLLFLICLFLSVLNCAVSQNKEEDLYLEILEIVLSGKVIELPKMDTIYGGDTCIFYSRNDGFITSTEERFEFTYGKYVIKVWPSDHVFFFNIKNYIQLNKFQVSNDTIILNLELFINKRSTENINIILGKKRESWRIKKKKVTPTAAKL
ncbi:MAG: hypothetical protein DRI89_01650 [Bacteroidetes bacterium]|nr:MAG: hypothetical protein DRI89_01650 [Bacteroidota bacterium]